MNIKINTTAATVEKEKGNIY